MNPVKDIVQVRPLTTQEIARLWPAPKRADTFPHCVSACAQGHKLCPCPELCEEGEDLTAATGIVRAVIWCLALYAVGASVWLFVIHF